MAIVRAAPRLPHAPKPTKSLMELLADAEMDIMMMELLALSVPPTVSPAPQPQHAPAAPPSSSTMPALVLLVLITVKYALQLQYVPLVILDTLSTAVMPVRTVLQLQSHQPMSEEQPLFAPLDVQDVHQLLPVLVVFKVSVLKVLLV